MAQADFRCLWNLGEFLDYNFGDFQDDIYGEPFKQFKLNEVRDGLRDLIRSSRQAGSGGDYWPSYPAVVMPEVMACSLSRRCCERFLELHKEMPLTDRDYYLSKFGQYMDILLEQMFGEDWREYYGPDWQPMVLRSLADVPTGLEPILAEFQWVDFIKAFKAKECRWSDSYDGRESIGPRSVLTWTRLKRHLPSPESVIEIASKQDSEGSSLTADAEEPNTQGPLPIGERSRASDTVAPVRTVTATQQDWIGRNLRKVRTEQYHHSLDKAAEEIARIMDELKPEASHAQFSGSTISRWERGKNPPYSTNFKAIKLYIERAPPADES